MKLTRFARSSFVKGSTLALAIVAATGAVGFGQGSVEKMLLDLEAQWEKASEASDGKALEPLLAPSFVFYAPDGTMQTKAEFVADAYKYKWQDTTGTDMKVTVTGDSAIVSGIWTGKGTDPKGRRRRLTSRVSTICSARGSCASSIVTSGRTITAIGWRCRLLARSTAPKRETYW